MSSNLKTKKSVFEERAVLNGTSDFYMDTRTMQHNNQHPLCKRQHKIKYIYIYVDR